VVKELIPLWRHQKDAALKAASSNGYGLFFEQGCGKTATAITALRYRCTTSKRLLRTLVLCPPVVRRSWQREFAMHSTIKKENVVVLEGVGKDRERLFQTEAFDKDKVLALGKIFITNYEALSMPKLFALLKKWNPEVMIVDESQRVKDIKAKRTKLTIELADSASYKMILTGTPILNSAMDIWAQFRVMDGGDTFDRNFYAFRARYFIDKNAGMTGLKKFPDWRPIPGLEKIFNDMIYRKATRVLKKDCLDLPPIVRQRADVELSSEQLRMYQSMKNDYVAYLNDKACVASIALTKGLRLQQMVSGFWVDEDGGEHGFKENPRLEALGELLADIGHTSKVIVWTNFRHSYKPILELCEKLKLCAVSLYGGMTDKLRQTSIDEFQGNPDVRVMVANPAAGGVGITLTAASYMIYYSRGFGLEHDLQSEARCHRGGSEIHDKITRIDIVATATIDEVILGALERKENLATDILKMRDLL